MLLAIAIAINSRRWRCWTGNPGHAPHFKTPLGCHRCSTHTSLYLYVTALRGLERSCLVERGIRARTPHAGSAMRWPIIHLYRVAAVWFLNFGPDPKPSRTGPRFGPGFGVGAEPVRRSGPVFGVGPNLRSEPGPNPEPEGQHTVVCLFFKSVLELEQLAL